MPVLAQRLGRHYTLLALAFPMILANISQPLLGLVDTAVLGHLGAPEYLAGTAVGAFLISQLYWLCGFFRPRVKAFTNNLSSLLVFGTT